MMMPQIPPPDPDRLKEFRDWHIEQLKANEFTSLAFVAVTTTGETVCNFIGYETEHAKAMLPAIKNLAEKIERAVGVDHFSHGSLKFGKFGDAPYLPMEIFELRHKEPRYAEKLKSMRRRPDEIKSYLIYKFEPVCFSCGSIQEEAELNIHITPFNVSTASFGAQLLCNFCHSLLKKEVS